MIASLHPLAGVSVRDMVLIGAFLIVLHGARRAGMWVYALVALPGTLLHELAHYLIALITGGRPSFPRLVPQRTPRGWQLGQVRFRAGHVRAMFVGVAPLLLFPLAAWWAIALLHPSTWPWVLVHAWIVAALLTACIPSSTDWRLAAPALVCATILVVGIYELGKYAAAS